MEESAAYATATVPVKLRVMPCPACGLIDTPRLGPGAGPHAAKVVCRHGHFIQWAPRMQVDPLLRKESPRMGSINKVILTGTISKYGVTVKYAPSGTPCASCALVLPAQG